MVNPSDEQQAGSEQAQPPAIQGIQPPTAAMGELFHRSPARQTERGL